ncbi:hypothetical protein F5884DRAFT_350405 [Xylogone sp. PMI_703]|nr:hypothetical protein F5884DRAFT_350405 [Xylogone sp. PMI_703]
MDVLVLMSQALAVCPGVLLTNHGKKSKRLFGSGVYRLENKFVMSGGRSVDASFVDEKPADTGRRQSTASKATNATASSQKASSQKTAEREESRRHRRHRTVKPHGKPFEIVILDNIRPPPKIRCHIENCRFLASYNSTKRQKATIFVPGAPARWTPRKVPFIGFEDDLPEASPERGEKIILPPSFAPFFAALQEMQPDYSLSSVSVVSDRSTLRKLFEFASGHPKHEWRMFVELIKDTLFIIAWDPDRHKRIGYLANSERTLESEFVRYDEGLESSTEHYRIVEYDLGGMKWVVRHEADGYVEDITEKVPPNTQSNEESKTLEGIEVIQKGRVVPADSVIEIKTKNSKPKSDLRGLEVEKSAPYWFSQTKSIFLVHHENEHVDVEPARVSLTDNFEDWERRQKRSLQKFITTIQEITEIARRVEGGRLCLYCDRRERQKAIKIFRSNEDILRVSEEARQKYWADTDA